MVQWIDVNKRKVPMSFSVPFERHKMLKEQKVSPTIIFNLGLQTYNYCIDFGIPISLDVMEKRISIFATKLGIALSLLNVEQRKEFDTVCIENKARILQTVQQSLNDVEVLK